MERLKAILITIGTAISTAIAVAAILAAITTAIAGIIFQSYLDSPSPAWLNLLKGNLARDLVLTAAAAILLAAALTAAAKFSLFREDKPHLNITREIHTQILGQSYRLVVVTATLHNASKVMVRPPSACCLLDQTAPLDDQYVETSTHKALRTPNPMTSGNIAGGAWTK